MRPSQSSPTKTLGADPISVFHYVLKGIAFRKLTELQLLKVLKYIESMGFESQSALILYFLPFWQNTGQAGYCCSKSADLAVLGVTSALAN